MFAVNFTSAAAINPPPHLRLQSEDVWIKALPSLKQANVGEVRGLGSCMLATVSFNVFVATVCSFGKWSIGTCHILSFVQGFPRWDMNKESWLNGLSNWPGKNSGFLPRIQLWFSACCSKGLLLSYWNTFEPPGSSHDLYDSFATSCMVLAWQKICRIFNIFISSTSSWHAGCFGGQRCAPDLVHLADGTARASALERAGPRQCGGMSWGAA